MKNTLFQISVRWSVIMILPLILPVNNTNANELGRLFTTKAERKMLDESRYAKKEEPEPIVIVFEEEEPEVEKPEIGGITVNGLVYRKGGKSTAWINDSNTLEGNLGNQYINVNAGDIAPGDVKVQIHDSDTKIRLKVGETYDTANEDVIDLTKTYTE